MKTNLGISPEEAARALRAIPSDKRSEKSRENGKKGRRPFLPISAIACTCGAGDAIEGHKSTCNRGKALKRRNAFATAHNAPTEAADGQEDGKPNP